MGLFTIRNIDGVLFFFNCNLWILFLQPHVIVLAQIGTKWWISCGIFCVLF